MSLTARKPVVYFQPGPVAQSVASPLGMQAIMQTSPCNEYPLTPHFYIVKLGFTGVYLIFLFLL